MPYIIYLPSSQLKTPSPSVESEQVRSLPGVIFSAIFRHPYAIGTVCTSIYLAAYHRDKLPTIAHQLHTSSSRLLPSAKRVLSTALQTAVSQLRSSAPLFLRIIHSIGSIANNNNSSFSPMAPTFEQPANGLAPDEAAKKQADSAAAAAAADTPESLANELRTNASDPNSFARPDQAKVVHMHLDLVLDFDQHILYGTVLLSVERVSADATQLLLDTHELTVMDVQLISSSSVIPKPLNYRLHQAIPEFGAKLAIDIANIGSDEKVLVHYQTSRSARALEWLAPEQTSGRLYPFVYSQCQAINARSMVPCQDTPEVKTTYTAQIEAPVQATVLMSAKIVKPPESSTEGRTQVHFFRQSVPIPSYLLAIAAGDIVSRQIGPRSSVWCERALLERAAYEFAEVETILTTAEALVGMPYLFEVYDLLVLPPSFPFGGMENPCLTFVTPTLLTGDRSLVSTICHEVAHSWTGNLVTNRNFDHFWLNEGFTVFLERKIQSQVGSGRLGEAGRHFAALEGLKELKATVDAMGHTNPLTKLVVDLRDINPDDAFCRCPYEKGHTFLFYLESLVGGPTVFEPFLRSYLEHFKYRSIVTDDFKSYLSEYFFKKVHAPEICIRLTEYDTSLLNACVFLAKKWISAPEDLLVEGKMLFRQDDWKAFSPRQKKLFLIELDEQTTGAGQRPLSPGKLHLLNELYRVREERNVEIATAWILLGLHSQWKEVIADAIKLVSEVGRLKYTRPIYRALFQWPETKQMALNTFQANRDRMMGLAVTAITAELQLK
ncbi:Leukotriene A-4 hydrolase [Tyrophagus putrescentiae]|nr:Leukotriene A-4 hydrolase [Tyrophagus putrescentiae]